LVDDLQKPVGILALQGDFAKHEAAFSALGQETQRVRRPDDLPSVSCLVIPGGESTTLTRLVDRVGLRQPICEFAEAHPVMGTCAGLIMMASATADEEKSDYGVEPLGLLDCTIARNGYGRQIDSFIADVNVEFIGKSATKFPAVFIRAPRITQVGPEVEVLVKHDNEPVLIRQGHLFGMTFHPELTTDLRIHRAFLSLA
jgi:5'-phosphate synthase pdxT subunit